MHFDIQNEKIWIQYDGTKELVAETLVELGVPPSNIVIGFYSPFKRHFYGFSPHSIRRHQLEIKSDDATV